MNKAMILGVQLAACAAALVGSVSDVQSATMSAMNGRPYHNSDSSCFSVSPVNGIQNTCSGNKTWFVPLQTYKPGGDSYTFRASSTGNGVGNPECRWVKREDTGELVAFGSTISVEANTSLGSTTVNTTDVVFVDCVIKGTNALGEDLVSVRF